MENKEIKLNFLHICDYASFDQMGKLNILGLFETINSIQFPYQHPQFFVVANLSISNSREYECVIRIIDLDKIEINKFVLPKVKINLNKNQSNTNLGIVGQFNGVKFEKPGKYTIEVMVDGNVVDSKEITVIQVINKNAEKK